MTRTPGWAAALAIVFAVTLLAACGGGASDEAQVASPTTAPQGSADSAEQIDEQARVQVVRDRASLGDPNAPVVIEEYSDFL